MVPQCLHYETLSNLDLTRGLNGHTLVETDSRQLEV